MRRVRVPVRPTWMRNPLLPKVTLKHAKAAQALALTTPPFLAKVDGHTTPAVSDVGGASLRLRFPAIPELQESGGYLVAVRSLGADSFLPAIAGVPWEKGMDREGRSRVGLGELMVLARPLAGVVAGEDGEDNERQGDAGPAESKVTFLHEQVLSEMYRIEEEVEVVVLAQLTDFFLGLNAGRWLLIRMNQLCDEAGRVLEEEGGDREEEGGGGGEEQGGGGGGGRHDDDDDDDDDDATFLSFLRGTGLELDPAGEGPEPPPEDQAHLFHHYSFSGNGGISGQRIVRREGGEERGS